MNKQTITRIIGAIILAALTYAAIVFLNREIHLITGLIIAVPSFMMLILSLFNLGKSFSVKAKAKELVTTGFYSKIQHPLYFFLDIMLLGGIIISGNPVLILFWLVLVTAHLIASNHEEKILSDAFGNKYSVYREKTWF